MALIQEGIDPNNEASLAAALHSAAYKGDSEGIIAMLAAIPKEKLYKISNMPDKDGHTALYWAAQNRQGKCVVTLLTHGQIEFDYPNNQKDIAQSLRNDTYDGDYNTVVAVLDAIPKDKRALIANIPNQDGCTALHWASQFGNWNLIASHLQCTLALVERGVLDWNDPDNQNDIARALRTAIRYGFSDDAIELLDFIPKDKIGIIANIPNDEGYTALYRTTQVDNESDWKTHIECALALLKKGVIDFNNSDNQDNIARLLRTAARWGYIHDLDAILDNIPKDKIDKIANITNDQGYTALHWAAIGKHEHCVAALVGIEVGTGLLNRVIEGDPEQVQNFIAANKIPTNELSLTLKLAKETGKSDAMISVLNDNLQAQIPKTKSWGAWLATPFVAVANFFRSIGARLFSSSPVPTMVIPESKNSSINFNDFQCKDIKIRDGIIAGFIARESYIKMLLQQAKFIEAKDLPEFRTQISAEITLLNKDWQEFLQLKDQAQVVELASNYVARRKPLCDELNKKNLLLLGARGIAKSQQADEQHALNMLQSSLQKKRM